MATRKLGPLARELDARPEAVVELAAALSDSALVELGAAIRAEVARRARSTGDQDAILEAAFERGFARDGLGVLPWIEAPFVVCPGGLVAKNRANHRCQFVSVDDRWVWESGDLIREDKRSVGAADEGFRAVALLPIAEGMALDVVRARMRQGQHSVERVTSLVVRCGRLVEVEAIGQSIGAEPYRSDGTAAGTALIGQVVSGGTSGSILDMLAVGNRAFFTAANPASGRELWVTDGQTLNLVKDIYPGEPNGVIAGTLRRQGNGVAFVASDGIDGLQIWTSDGTANGTVQVGKIGPIVGAGAAEIGELTTIGTDTWFWADEGITGREPWRISITGVAASISSYGLGCAGTGGVVPVIGANGLPRLGNASWAFEVGNGLPFSVALLVVGFTPTNVPVGTCRIHVAPPWFVQPTTFLDGSGAGLAPVPIPNTASLAGTSLYGQWVVIDPVAPLLGLGSSSGGLAAQIGN